MNQVSLATQSATPQPAVSQAAPANHPASAAPDIPTRPSTAGGKAAKKRGPDQFTHWTLLLSSAVVLLLAACMSTKGDQQVALPFMKAPLPGLCTSRTYFGIDCPGCGLTRCFISLAHGEVARAWHFNPGGLWFFAIVVAQIPYRSLQLWRIHSGRQPIRISWLNWCMWILLFMLVSQWLVKLVLGAS